ncbi:MAG: hypothetical protein WBO34_08680 [Gammaproteobacteria bacterium]
MPDLCRMLLTAGCCLLLASPLGAQDIVLKTNPFLQPVSPEPGPTAGTQEEDKRVAEMELRATMVAGERSQANIGGVVIGLGEEVNGYRLDEIHPRHVVLDRDGARKEVWIANAGEGSRD